MEYEKDAASIFKRVGQIRSFAVQTVKTPLNRNQIELKNEKYYISKCCNNNICIKCTDNWFKSLKKENCIYCSTKNISLDSYLKYEKNYVTLVPTTNWY